MKNILLLISLLICPFSQGVNLIHHWDFNQDDPTAGFVDLVSGDNGWKLNGVGAGGYNPGNITLQPGMPGYGNSVYLPGDNVNNGAYLTSTGTLPVSSDFSMTIMGWVNPSTGHDNALFSVGGDGEGFKIGITNGKLSFTTKNVLDFPALGSEATVSLNTWSHVAISMSRVGNNWVLDFFIGGQNVGHQVIDSAMNTGNLAGFSINSKHSGGGDLLTNSFDDVKIYDGVMTEAEVQEAMKAVPEPTVASLGLLGLSALLLRRRRLA